MGLRRGKPHVCKEEGIRNGMFTLRAPRASSQVELRATFSSWPHSGQGLCRGTGGQHTQTFPSCMGVGRARQPRSEQTQGSLSLPLTSWFQLSHPKSHRGAFSEVLSQLGILTGENGASHAKHDTEHRKQGEERDLGREGVTSGPGPSPELLLYRISHPLFLTHFLTAWHQLESQFPFLRA